VLDFVPKEWVEKFGTVGQKVGQHLVGEGVEQAARVGTRIGTKFLPFVGWALLAVGVVTVAVIAYEVFFAPASPAWTPAPGKVPLKPPAPKPPIPMPRLIDKTLDFNKVGTAMSTSINALAGLAVGAVAGGGTGFGICGLSGSISSCLLPALDVTNNCASMTAAAHLCAPTEPVPGTPGRMGSAVDAAPVTAPGGAGQGSNGGNGRGNSPGAGTPDRGRGPDGADEGDGGDANLDTQNLADLFSDGATPSATELINFAKGQGWTEAPRGSGPIKLIDSNGVSRLTLTTGSPRTPGSELPHVEIRNPRGLSVDPNGNLVLRKSIGNHTPIEWDC